MKFQTQLVAIACIAGAVLACGTSSSVSSTDQAQKHNVTATFAVSQNRNQAWLADRRCQLPCLLGIWPGRTTYEQATQIAVGNADIVVFKSSSAVTKKRNLDAKWGWDGVFSDIELSFIGLSPTATLHLIQARLTTTESLRTFIAQYGPPTHVLVSAGRGPDIGSKIYRSASLFWLHRGVAIRLPAVKEPNRPVLSRELTFNQFDVFPPTIDAYSKAMGWTPEAALNALVPWDGFRSFEHYCSKVKFNEVDVC
jgi:hypothetical protein